MQNKPDATYCVRSLSIKINMDNTAELDTFVLAPGTDMDKDMNTVSMSLQRRLKLYEW